MSKRIVVIDDDPDIVQILKTTLKSKGYEVLTAPDGEEGLRLIGTSEPDLIILDLMMPKLSGLEVCRRLRENDKTRHIPIIVLSAIGEKTGKPEEFWRMGLGTEDFISKPFDPVALLGRVEYVLRRHQYVSSGGQAEGGEGAARVPRPSLSDATPREIVRCFIEAWNGQNFADEWECLDESMRGPLEKTEYIARRQRAYATEIDSPRRQKMAAVVEQQIESDTATLTVEREETVGNRTSRRREQYSLKKTADGWKITSVRVLPK